MAMVGASLLAGWIFGVSCPPCRAEITSPRALAPVSVRPRLVIGTALAEPWRWDDSGPRLATHNPLTLVWDGWLASSARLDSKGSLSLPMYGAAAMGAMGFGAYDALGSTNDAGMTDLEAACLTRGCSAAEESELEHKRAADLWARVGLAVGVMGIGSAITLWVLDEGDDGPTALMVSPSGVFVRGKM